MRKKLLVLICICSALYSCKFEDVQSINSPAFKKPSSAFNSFPNWQIVNPFDDIYPDIDNGGLGRGGFGSGTLGPNAPLVQAQIDAVNIAKANLIEMGITDFEEGTDKLPKTMQVHILTQCQYMAFRDYYQTCATIVNNYDRAKGDCLRSVGYTGAALTLLSNELSWAAFTAWIKTNRGMPSRQFMWTISITNLAATECVYSKLQNANSDVADAHKSFSAQYARCN